MEDITFTEEQAKQVGDQLKIDWEEIDIEQFTKGMNVELEHGSRDPRTNVTDNDPILTGKIALAHILELDDYYDRLEEIEKDE